MNNLFADVVHGFRRLKSKPLQATLIVLTLALGIGANTAIFSFVDAVLLRRMPYPEPDRIVQLWGSNPARAIPFHNVTYSDVSDWHAQSRTVEMITACSRGPAALSGAGDPQRVDLWRVNHAFFELFGVQFARGRGFGLESDRPGAERVAVLSYETWQRLFSSDPSIVGRAITLDGASYTVTGVVAQGFTLAGTQVEMLTPFALAEGRTQENDRVTMSAYGRLRSGATLPSAQADFDRIGDGLRENRRSLSWNPRVWGMRDFVVRNDRSSLILLQCAVGLMLLIACANIANLLLAQLAVRHRELALRTALGAGRSRLVRMLLTESAILVLTGGALGVLIAKGGIRVLLAVSPEGYALWRGATLDGRALLFALLVSMVTVLLFGFAPAVLSSRSSSLHQVLKEGGRGSTAGRHRLRSALVAAEVGLAFVLMAGAGLLARTFFNLRNSSPGFDAKGVVAALVSLPASRYAEPPSRTAFYDRLLPALQAIPGARSVGLVSSLPLSGHNSGTGLFIEGRPVPQPRDVPIVWFRSASSGYFKSMGIPLQRGRVFEDSERAPVAVINETMARRFWPGDDPVGKRFTNNMPGDGRAPQWITIVGVVGDMRHLSLKNEYEPEVFWPYLMGAPDALHIVARADGDTAALLAAIRRTVASIDSQLPLAQPRLMEERMDEALGTEKISSFLLTLFSAFALVLASIGIFGVISCSVASRTQEIGVRMALGARSRDLLLMVVRQALMWTLAGLVVGGVCAAAMSRLVAGLLFGVRAGDPLLHAGAAFTLCLCAALAAWVPARRASRSDPMAALHNE